MKGSQYRKVKLSDISRHIQYGYTASASPNKIGPKFLRITDIQESSVNWDNVPYCKISSTEYTKYKLHHGDIVIARTGNSTGAHAYIEDDVDAVFASYLIRFNINSNIAYPKYINYLMQTNKWNGFISSVSTGSAQMGANAQRLGEFELSLPPLPEQKRISNILSSFDNKIELLRKENNTLEDIAQSIFKEWFVKYNFPNKDGKPYRDNNGKMIDSELGLIPEGWRVGKLGEVVNFIVDNRGKTPNFTTQKEGNMFPMVEVNSLIGSSRCLNLDICKKYVTKEIYKEWFRKGHPQKGDILLSTVGSIGQICQVFDEEFCIAQNIISLRSDIFSEYLYELLKNIKNDLVALNISSVQPSIKVPHFLNMRILIPELKIIKRFNGLNSKLSKKIFENTKRQQNLIAIHNNLLNKLIK